MKPPAHLLFCSFITFLFLIFTFISTTISTFDSPWFGRKLDANLFLSNFSEVEKLFVQTKIDVGLVSGCKVNLQKLYGDGWSNEKSVPCQSFVPNDDISLKFDLSWVNQCKIWMIMTFVTEILLALVIFSSPLYFCAAFKKFVQFLWPFLIFILLILTFVSQTTAVISSAEYKQTWLTTTNYHSDVNESFSSNWIAAVVSCCFLCFNLIIYGISMAFFVAALIQNNHKSSKKSPH